MTDLCPCPNHEFNPITGRYRVEDSSHNVYEAFKRNDPMVPVESMADLLPDKEVTLIGLSGYARSGKDSVGRILERDYGFTPVAFADKLKAVAEEINPRVACVTYDPKCTVPLLNLLRDHGGWEGAKENYPGVREFLQTLGVACRNHIHPDVWCRALLDGLEPGKRYVITDVRFPNEYELIRNLGGQMWRVERPGTGAANGHISESAISTVPFDRIINNAGDLDALRTAVMQAR